MSISDEDFLNITRPFEQHKKAFSGFMHNVVDFFNRDNDSLHQDGRFVIHSVKYRTKDRVHLREKIVRKIAEGVEISEENILNKITDFCGIRVLHLRLSDIGTIHRAIEAHLHREHWVLAEAPKAYTWDPEYKEFFENLGLNANLKSSFYTSVHYLVKPHNATEVCCEIQVRTLFEEIWGEIDHELNYPKKSESISQQEQIKVLAKLVGAGNKLIDSIHKS